MNPVLLLLTLVIGATRDTPLVVRTISNDARVADAAIAALRERGPRGVELMVQSGLSDQRFHAALDRVCRQRDCYTSQLYWYTDLERAKAAAKASGKPILSLHLLGYLDEELSCANSRFFRTTLYSSPKIAAYMRENFILHWVSVRPVPKITVEFGDGRVLHQTITGNSIHYLLDESGRPLEALPGLYSPAEFLSQLQAMSSLAKEYSAAGPAERDVVLQTYHSKAWQKIADDLGTDLRLVRATVDQGKRPSAMSAARMTMSKMGAEASLLAAFDLQRNPISDGEWKRIAARHGEAVVFDPASIAFMRKKSRTFDRALENLEASVAEDTVRNELDLHRRIHEWFMTARVGALAELNERVYAELFLTPGNDPWLGLLPEDRFTAIRNAGVEYPR